MPASSIESPLRSRTRPEAAFAIMRALLKGRLLWPYDGALPLEALEALVDAPLSVLTSALAHLSAEGVVLVDREAGTVRLSADVVREMRGAPLLH
jgi:hypothetical protein